MKIPQKIGLLERIFPIFIEYNASEHAETLYEREEGLQERMNELGLGVTELSDYLQAAHNSKYDLFRSAQRGDTLDVFTSLAGMSIDAIFAITAPWVLLVTLSEEAIEMIPKRHMIKHLWREGKLDRLWDVGLHELKTAFPFAGDIYDIISNRFVEEAYREIEEGAVRQIAALPRPGYEGGDS